MLRVGYLEKGRLAQANFEVSMNYAREQQDAIKRIHNCVDAAASMMMEYFKNDGEVDFPYTWKEFPFQSVRKCTCNSIPKILLWKNKPINFWAPRKIHFCKKKMKNDEDALSRAEHSEELSPLRRLTRILEDEDVQRTRVDKDTGPRMFSGKSKKKKTTFTKNLFFTLDLSKTGMESAIENKSHGHSHIHFGVPQVSNLVSSGF